MSDRRFYTIIELCEIVNRTAATLYSYMRIDKETKQFFKEHRKERTKGGFVYDEEALNRLKKRFMVEDAVPMVESESENDEIPIITAPHIAEIDKLSRENAALSAELEDLRGKIAALQADFERVEGERVELLRQNGLKTDEINHLLLLLSQEKAEKQALLPPPRKTIGEKLKRLFKRNS